MAECMAFPKTADEFIGQYKFTDTKQEYTNGAELIPVFRVKQMMEHYFAKDNNVPSKWIPVTERLPEEDVLVLCIGAKGGMFLGYPRFVYKDDGFAYTRVPNARGSRHATHWMPLPEAPKGE